MTSPHPRTTSALLQFRILNVTGFRPATVDGSLLLRVLYSSIDLDLHARQLGPRMSLAKGSEVANYLARIRHLLCQAEADAHVQISYLLVFHMNDRLGEMIEAVRAFRAEHLSDMQGAPPRLSLAEGKGRNILLFRAGQAEDQKVQDRLVHEFGGVREGAVGQGGILMTRIGGLITISCAPGEKTVSGVQFEDFIFGRIPLPVVDSGIRVRTESGRLTRPPAAADADFMPHEAPTTPGKHASGAPFGSDDLPGPRDSWPTIEVVGEVPLPQPNPAPVESEPPPATPRKRPLRLRDLPLDPSVPHRAAPVLRKKWNAPPPPPVSPRYALRPPPPKDDSDPDSSKGQS